jgi:hypothetical protein
VNVALPAKPTVPTSWSSQEVGNGSEVTSNTTGLLSFMLGATETTMYPDVAPVGIVIVMEVALQELIVTGTSFSSTSLLLCVAPNPVPDITTWLPTDPVVLETPVITGPGAAVELIDTLSNVAVVK